LHLSAIDHGVPLFVQLRHRIVRSCLIALLAKRRQVMGPARCLDLRVHRVRVGSGRVGCVGSGQVGVGAGVSGSGRIKPRVMALDIARREAAGGNAAGHGVSAGGSLIEFGSFCVWRSQTDTRHLPLGRHQGYA
jgi:hypothetical protein